MQLKALVKNIAKEKNISAQLVLQNYILERLLERISLSEYQKKFILKGGMLIAAMVGLDSRATMDMDATIKRYPLNEKSIRKAFDSIILIDAHDDITFEIVSIKEIREDTDYGGLRVSLNAKFEDLNVPLKVDVTVGDIITPKEIIYKFDLLFEPRQIEVYAYNLETVLAEKVETIISRSTANTRPRDFYDVYILTKFQSTNISTPIFAAALHGTAQKRNSVQSLSSSEKILHDISNDRTMNERWRHYQKEFNYASDIEFTDVLNSIKELIETIKEI